MQHVRKRALQNKRFIRIGATETHKFQFSKDQCILPELT